MVSVRIRCGVFCIIMFHHHLPEINGVYTVRYQTMARINCTEQRKQNRLEWTIYWANRKKFLTIYPRIWNNKLLDSMFKCYFILILHTVKVLVWLAPMRNDVSNATNISYACELTECRSSVFIQNWYGPLTAPNPHSSIRSMFFFLQFC